MTVRRGVWAWLTNWRNGATLAVTVIAVAVLFVVVDSSRGRDRALDALERQTRQQADDRAAASRRIDMLQARIDDLVGRGETNNVLLGQLVGEIEALRSQVRSLGAEPVVGEPPTAGVPVVPGPGASRPQESPSLPPPAPAPPAGPPPSDPPPSAPSTPGPTTTTTTRPPGPEPSGLCRLAPVPVVCSTSQPVARR